MIGRRPNFKKGAKVCLVETKDTVTLYLNSVACYSFGKIVSWISKSNPEENYEIHIFREVSSFDADDSSFCSFRDLSCVDARMPEFGVGGRDINFMMLSEYQILRLFKLSDKFSGIVPLIWNESSESDIDELLA